MSETIVIESLESIAFGLPADDVTVIEIESTGAAGAAGTNGTNGGSTSAWNYKAKTNATSGYPGNGYLLWNNATQTSATSIIVSHLTDDDTDIELFLSFFVVGQKIFIQDRDDSSKNQVWLISGTPTVTGANTSTAYYTFPVTLVSSAGGAFTNNHSILFGQISVATNAVTSATTSNGTAELTIATLTINDSDGSISLTGLSNQIVLSGANAEISMQGANGKIQTGGAGGHIRTLSALAAVISDSFKANSTTGTLRSTNDDICLQFGTSGGKNLTITAGTTFTLNNTSFTYGTGAAAAHRTALGLTTLATTTAGTGVITALGNNANGAGGFVTDSGTVANATNADYATIAGNATTANEVSLSGVTGLGTSVATALAINLGSSGAIVTSNSTDTLTNKTLTSPAINSATFGTAATFNATTYTYGTGAATEHMASIVSGSGIGNIFCYDEFVGTSATGGGIGELGWAGGTTVAIRGNETGHPGIIRVSATATGSLYLNYLAGAGNPDSYNGLTIEVVFRIGAITNCKHIFGVGYVNAYLTNGFRGITFDPANSANWRLHHRTSAGADTFTDTGKAAVANDWVRVKLTFASGLTTCTIATTTSTTEATVTNTGAYTVGTAAHTTQWVFQSTSGTQTLDVDAFMMHGKTTRL
jgi:hypothetical protein